MRSTKGEELFKAHDSQERVGATYGDSIISLTAIAAAYAFRSQLSHEFAATVACCAIFAPSERGFGALAAATAERGWL